MPVLKFERGGRIKAVWDDALAEFFSRLGPEFAAARRRASLIMTVESGPFAGCFFADLSHLADLTKDDSHRVCLYPPRPLESQCKRDEVAYIYTHFITGLPPEEE